MKTLNATTKRAQGFIYSYAKAKAGSTLYTVYTKPSDDKQKAWEYCRRVMSELNGYDMRITGKGTYTFSCAFKFRENGRVFLAYFTAYNTYIIDLYPNT